MTPSPLTSTPSRFSSSFISGAISSAASPLQANFNLSCRSPVRPTHDGGLNSPRRPATAIRQATSPYLEPPRAFPFLGAQSTDAKVIYDGLGRDDAYDYDDDDDTALASEDESPTDRTWFLPPSPGLPPVGLRREEEGKLGVISAINIIVGKTVGVGAYSVPSAIFDGVGSVGMTLLLWVIGSLISFCGLAVYLDLGTAIPKSGGERVYLERIFRRPYMLATCMFMSYVVLLGFSTPNAIVLGEYALYAADVASNRWNVRAIAVASVSVFCYIHARHPRLGLRLINVLGVAKMLILVIVILSGIAGGLMGVGSDRSPLRGRRLDADLTGADMALSTAKRNFRDIWAGSSSQPYDYATALLKVIYCFRGYSTANQVLSDIKNPVRTLKVAAPVALTLVSLAYLAINIAFFLVVDKDDFKSAGVVVAGIFFRNVFGPGAGAHILPLFVIISAAGNIAATSFAQARVNEELAKDGLLPWSGFWASSSSRPPTTSRYPHRSSSPTKNRPPGGTTAAAAAHHLPLEPHHLNNSHGGSGSGSSSSNSSSSRSSSPPGGSPPPSRGLLLHWLVSVAVIVLPPPGRIYNFLVDIGGYPVSVISVAVSVGLLYLHTTPAEGWVSPCRAPRAAVIVFAAGNCLLLLLPWVPPAGGRGEDEKFAYYAYPATALAVLAAGAAYWCWWRVRGNGRGRQAANAQGGGSGGGSTARRVMTSWTDGSSFKDTVAEDAARGLLSPEAGESSSVAEPMLELDLRNRAPCGCVMLTEK